jgi:hypothetical protein
MVLTGVAAALVMMTTCLPTHDRDKNVVPRGSVSGQVTGSEEMGITFPGGALVEIEGHPEFTTNTDPDGKFLIEDIPEGEYTVNITGVDSNGKENILKETVVIVGGNEVKLGSLNIVQTGAIRGYVALSDGADPLGVLVYVPGTSFDARCDETGYFIIIYLPAGNYRVRAEEDGYAAEEVLGVAVSKGDVTDIGTMTLRTNDPPVAEAGPDQVVYVGDIVQLDGSASFDPDGDTVTFQWVQTSGPPMALYQETTPTPRFLATDIGVLNFELNVSDGYVPEVTDTIKVEVYPPCEPAVNAGSTINSSSDDRHPFITPDGSKLIFASDRPGGYGGLDFYVTTLVNEVWQLPVNMGSTINSAQRDSEASLYDNDIRIIFSSWRLGGLGESDIYQSQYVSGAWQPPVSLGTPINSSSNDTSPKLLNGGNTLVFDSRRSGGIGNQDIWESTFDGLNWNEPTVIGDPFSTSANDGDPAFLSDQSLAFVCSQRSGGYGTYDIYMMLAVGNGWTTAVNMDQEINSNFIEGGPSMSDDGTFVFISDRNGGYGNYDIYFSHCSLHVGDTDGDLMPDEWEEGYGCVDAVGGDSLGDPDGDGFTNLEEYVSGYDPCAYNECADGLDNDGDLLPDLADPGCLSDSDTSEHGTNQCDDGIDNDSDTLTDWPDDPDCFSLTDDSEANFSMSFDGINDYIEVPHSSTLNLDFNATIEAWIKITGCHNGRIIAKSRGNGDDMGWENKNLMVMADCYPGIYYWNTMGSTHLKGNIVVPLSLWTHLAGVYNGSMVSIYMNGQLVGSRAASGNIADDIDRLFIARADLSMSTEYFNGLVDELRWWNVTRTQQQIQDNMYRELVGDEPGLMGYWNFNEGSGQTAFDSSGHGNNGRLGDVIDGDSADPVWVVDTPF